MKKAFFAFALVLVSHSASAGTFVENVQQSLVRSSIQSIEVQDLVNWKVGDYANYNISMGGFPLGDMKKSVTKDEGKAIWVVTEAAMMGQKDKTEILINKEDGAILKFIHNGKEEAAPSNDGIEVIDQEYTEVKVPAGTFKCVHLTIKTPEVEKAEIWISPKETVMEGLLKQTVHQNGMDVAVELAKFGHGKQE